MKGNSPQIIDATFGNQFPKLDKSLIASCPNSPLAQHKVTRSRQSKLVSKGMSSFNKHENLSIHLNRNDGATPIVLSESFSMNGEQKWLNVNKNKFPILHKKDIVISKRARKTPIITNLPSSLSISQISQSREVKHN